MEGDDYILKDKSSNLLKLFIVASGDLKKSNLTAKFGTGFHTSNFKSLFDKEGNPFKYFKDIKKHINTSSVSFQ